MNGYYINLEFRKDRNEHIINNIKKYQFFKNINRLNAVYDKGNGAMGVVKSHIKVLELCLQENNEYYLIMEDDFEIINENYLFNFIKDFEKIKNNINWDLITLTH